MQLSPIAELALRALILLARIPASGHRTTAASLAGDLGISVSHANRVLAPFVDAGLVDSLRGRGGGIAITPAGLEATASRIVELVEASDPATHPRDADSAPSGRLLDAIAAARAAAFDALARYTIAELAAAPPRHLGLRGEPTIGSQN